VPQVGIINPGEFEPSNSIEVVVWAAVGGRGTIVGPIIGALLVNAGKSWFTGVLPEFWLFALGGLFVAVTLFLPKGIIGMWDSWRGNAKAMRAAAIAEEAGSDADAPPPKIVRSAATTPGAWPASGPEPQPAE
jgi:urea transport system permease protein